MSSMIIAYIKDIFTLRKRYNQLIKFNKDLISTIKSLEETSLAEISKLNEELTSLRNKKTKLLDKSKELNTLRANVISLTKSRDSWKNKYKELVWKVSRNNYCHK